MTGSPPTPPESKPAAPAKDKRSETASLGNEHQPTYSAKTTPNQQLLELREALKEAVASLQAEIAHKEEISEHDLSNVPNPPTVDEPSETGLQHGDDFEKNENETAGSLHTHSVENVPNSLSKVPDESGEGTAEAAMLELLMRFSRRR